ncbi:hypothetical protein HY745_04145 [Candidatus Desantisbacteria bacterium]|nr:hypothetical protein [Candidatus Desantisbacteria bacterium]
MTKKPEERNIEREGNYLIGLDNYNKNFLFTAIYAPHIKDLQQIVNRSLLKVQFMITPIKTDMSLYYFNGDIPGIGTGISKTINEQYTFYTESVLRRGSDIKKLIPVGNNISSIYKISELYNQDETHPHIAAGSRYKFNSNMNLIFEYIYNGDGYSGKEWDEFIRLLKYSSSKYKEGSFTDIRIANLLLANKIIKFKEMRNNYFYTRISVQDIMMIDTDLTLFLNADDKSFFLNPTAVYNINKDSTILLSVITYSGNNDTEFGMTHWANEVCMRYKYLF